ncbi:Putative transcriptional regulator, TetR-family [Corynebacterium glyciniphilum AJ 3170]|uniref:Putative transcriptional regulator, TetR-family n=1 Tax=Corynebacterium glyciniphilum AJ 3170 TaxID=1404245 RepID=X5DJ09_9CORY|nr:Putative transcriptional regulator, TetR-family [Corynebacterium glyciniphilum AJ 3170]
MVESMPMSRVAQQERSKVTRRRLLEASLDTLSDVGLAGTTVSAVAARAGVSRGAAQHHFPTRDSLVEAALEEFFAERTQQLRSSVAKLSTGSGAAAVDAVDEVVTLIFGFFSNRPFHAALHIWAAASTDDSLRELIVPAEARYGREVYQLTALALNADLSDQHTRRLLGLTLDVARGLGLGSVLVDTRKHQNDAIKTWSRILDGIKRND